MPITLQWTLGALPSPVASFPVTQKKKKKNLTQMQVRDHACFSRKSHESAAVYKKRKSFITLGTQLPVALHLQFTYNRSRATGGLR